MRLRGSAAVPIILALALLLRIGVIVATPDFKPILDAAEYDRHAVSIANGHGYPSALGAPSQPSAYRPPLYPLSLAAAHLAGGGWTAGRVFGALLGVATVLLVFLISRRLWGRPVALVAAGLTAVFPPLVLLNASLLSEPLFVALLLAALLVTLRYREDQRLRWAALAGVLCGLATLTRTTGLLLVLPTLVGVWTVKPRARQARLFALLVVVGFTMVTLTPWLVRNTIVFHRFVGISTQGGDALAATYNDESRRAGHPGYALPLLQITSFRDVYGRRDLDEADRNTRLGRRGVEYMVDHPGFVAATVVWNTLRVFDLEHDGVPFDGLYQGITLMALGVGRVVSPVVPISVWLIAALAFLGIVAQTGFLAARRAPPFVWLIPALMLISALVTYGLERYRAPIDPFLIMLAAVGIVGVAQRTGALGGPARPKAASGEASSPGIGK